MNCKPGDLAVVIAAMRTPEIIGRIVEVRHVAVNGDVFRAQDGYFSRIVELDGVAWCVTSSRALPWRLLDGTLREFAEVPIMDAHLRPVSGLPVEEEIRDMVGHL